MKALATLLVAISFTFAARAQHSDAPPSLSLAKAASIAEEKIIEMKLPAEFYLRSIYLTTPISEDSGPAYYIALYAPKSPASDLSLTRRPTLDKFIRIDLNGTTTLVGSEMKFQSPERPQRIIIRPKPPESSTSTKEDKN